mgnify:CR=1 FL=1
MINSTRLSQQQVYLNLYEGYKGTPMAVSSESLAHKALRFSQIASIFKDEDDISVHDIGMGIADFYQFLLEKSPGKKISYSGTEILPEFVAESSNRFPECKFYLRDVAEQAFDDHYDYVVMSGVFHQRRDSTIPEWERFYQELLVNAFSMCRKGLAFNFISPFVDFYQTEVYYCNIYKLLNFLTEKLSRFFTIQHNYALFEFTVFVYKEEFVLEKHPQAEFRKYFKTA